MNRDNGTRNGRSCGGRSHRRHRCGNARRARNGRDAVRAGVARCRKHRHSHARLSGGVSRISMTGERCNARRSPGEPRAWRLPVMTIDHDTHAVTTRYAPGIEKGRATGSTPTYSGRRGRERAPRGAFRRDLAAENYRVVETWLLPSSQPSREINRIPRRTTLI